MLPVSALNTIVLLYTIKLHQKSFWRNLALINFYSKRRFFTEIPAKMFCINVFNVGGCLASC